MRNIKLTIEYDGTNYHGWQSQQNAVTVQDTVIKAVRRITGEEVNLTGSSRTDTGVHAYGQVANFFTESRIPVNKFPLALNSALPDDVVVRDAEEVEEEFHSRFSSKGKKYRYLICNSTVPSALMRNRAFFVPGGLDIKAMDRASRHFLGKHDFSAFKATGSSVKSNERTITDVSLRSNGELIEFEIQGDGFLYNMVRIIAGTLVYVGLGKINADDIPAIIRGGDRRKAGKTAPAHGLYLVEVHY
ncbi:MAG: tRNA pseudouridine(38-40) synthase TruA [Clostridia bacterium]|nr:tRNA pseudouridine(38-40) synthase TruA [Clostridia bacterium]